MSGTVGLAQIMAVAAGGAFGSALRYVLSHRCESGAAAMKHGNAILLRNDSGLMKLTSDCENVIHA